MISRAHRWRGILSGLGIFLCAGGAAQVPGRIDGLSAAAPFSTKLGTFTPRPWSALSGWDGEAHSEALEVFRQTCRNLQRRETWRPTCAAAQSTGSDPGEARAFFESQFVPYMVSPNEQGKEGLMTGYFEPILDGSVDRKAPFVVPVHGVPPDLLQLDARRWQGVATDGTVRAAITGDQVVPATARGAQDAGIEPGFELDPAVFESEPLDRRYRVRRQGHRIVPYWTRQQIEAGMATGVPVIAWVDDPQALYLMQVQGSGQIRLPGARTIRLSYADQNGHPFRPRGIVPTASRTRSLPGAGAGDAGPVAVVTPISMRTLSLIASDQPGARLSPRKGESKKADRKAPVSERVAAAQGVADVDRSAGAAPNPGSPATGAAHDVERIVDALLAEPSPGKVGGVRLPAPVLDSGSGAGGRDPRATANLSYLVAAREKDPSYVFFQSAATGGSGPMGALGVPLTATRSIAVDPRSTPLGSPVFIEAERADSAEPLRRLMIAQDTGGAIRGAVRADFFWGTGPKAGAQAVRTRDDLAMWVLLPKNYARPKGTGTRTRGVGAAASAECVMPDSDYCLE
jgi:membrane-bound lytic murein transglycosylase A